MIFDHSLLNFENKDHIGFKYSVLAALIPPSTHKKKQDSKWYKKQLQRLDFTHCFFSMNPADILMFKLAIIMAINGLKNEIVPFFLSKRNIKK